MVECDWSERERERERAEGRDRGTLYFEQGTVSRRKHTTPDQDVHKLQK